MNAKINGHDVEEVSAMTEDRIRKLEDLGFIWVLRGDGKPTGNFDDGLEYDLDVGTVDNDDAYPYRH
jgi:hypothetical protein